jgi:hypothetical protein
MPLLDRVNPDTVAAALRARCGRSLSGEQIDLRWRSWRWMATLPDSALLFVPDHDRARRRLLAERALLSTLAGKLSFTIPRPLPCGDDGAIDLRAPAAGGRARHPTNLDRFAEDFGRALGELHTAVPADVADGFGLDPDPWPPANTRVNLARAGLPAALLPRALAVLDRWEGPAASPGDRTVVHGDFGTHNFVFSDDGERLCGVFDVDAAGVGDRHLDLKYLPSYGRTFMARALASYGRVSGASPSVEAIFLHHAAAALGYLAWRVDDPYAHDHGSGRDFAGAVAWAERAVADALAPPVLG